MLPLVTVGGKPGVPLRVPPCGQRPDRIAHRRRVDGVGRDPDRARGEQADEHDWKPEQGGYEERVLQGGVPVEENAPVADAAEPGRPGHRGVADGREPHRSKRGVQPADRHGPPGESLPVGPGDREEDRATGRIKEVHREAFGAFGDKIDQDGDAHNLQRLPIGEGDGGVGTNIVGASGGGDIERSQLDGDEAGAAIGPDDADLRVSASLIDDVIGTAQEELAGREVVVVNFQGSAIQSEEGFRAGIEQAQVEGLGAFDERIIDDRHLETLDHFARQEAQDPIGADEILENDGGARSGFELDRKGGIAAESAPDGNTLHAARNALARHVIRVNESDEDFVIANRQAGTGLRPVGGAAGVIQEFETRNAVFVRDKIIQHANHKQLFGFARREREGAVGGHIILAGDGSQVHGAERDADNAGGATAAANRDDGVRAVFVDRVFGARKLEAASAGNRAAVDARNVAARLIVVAGEAATDDNLAVGLQVESRDETIGAATKIDAGVG